MNDISIKGFLAPPFSGKKNEDPTEVGWRPTEDRQIGHFLPKARGSPRETGCTCLEAELRRAIGAAIGAESESNRKRRRALGWESCRDSGRESTGVQLLPLQDLGSSTMWNYRFSRRRSGRPGLGRVKRDGKLKRVYFPIDGVLAGLLL
jgi:hypothetical protein